MGKHAMQWIKTHWKGVTLGIASFVGVVIGEWLLEIPWGEIISGTIYWLSTFIFIILNIEVTLGWLILCFLFLVLSILLYRKIWKKAFNPNIRLGSNSDQMLILAVKQGDRITLDMFDAIHRPRVKLLLLKLIKHGYMEDWSYMEFAAHISDQGREYLVHNNLC